jgi:hypothetical protein
MNRTFPEGVIAASSTASPALPSNSTSKQGVPTTAAPAVAVARPTFENRAELALTNLFRSPKITHPPSRWSSGVNEYRLKLSVGLTAAPLLGRAPPRAFASASFSSTETFCAQLVASYALDPLAQTGRWPILEPPPPTARNSCGWDPNVESARQKSVNVWIRANYCAWSLLTW